MTEQINRSSSTWKALPWLFLIATSSILIFVILNDSDGSSKQPINAVSRVDSPSMGISKIEQALISNDTSGSGYIIDGVVFLGGSSRLDTTSYAALNQLVEVLEEFPDSRIRIEGYCTQQENLTTNLKISHQRAKAASNYLKNQGISSSRIRIAGRGNSSRRNIITQGVSIPYSELLEIYLDKK